MWYAIPMEKQCSFQECLKPLHGRGLCSAHYRQFLTRGKNLDRLEPLQEARKVRGICSFEGCERPHKSKGYCESHYAQYHYRGGDTTLMTPLRMTKPPVKVCTYEGCGRVEECRGLCYSHWAIQKRGEELRPIRATLRFTPEDSCAYPNCPNTPKQKHLCTKHAYLWVKYRLTPVKIETLFTGASCQVCNRSDIRLHVDHDHTCCSDSERTCGNCIRGLLCSNCNTALGLTNEDPKILRNLIVYLEKNSVIIP